MATNNETVAEIREDVREYLTSIGPSEYPSETQFEEFADRFEAAHRREILVHRHLADEYLAAKDLKILKLQQRLKTAEDAPAAKDDERLTVVANYENVIAAKDRIIIAKDAEIEGLQRTLDLHDLYADEECEDADTARIVAENVADAKDAEIAELQRRLKVAEDALKEAVDEFCANCTASADDRRELCDQCVTCEWKEALAAIRGEGGNDENK